MPPTTKEILKGLLEKGIEEVKPDNLVPGCDYLIVHLNGVDLPSYTMYHGKYIDYKDGYHRVSHHYHYKGVDEEGDPIFQHDSKSFPLDEVIPVYGTPKWYTYDPYECDGDVLAERKKAANRFKEGTRSRSRSRGGGKRRSRRRRRRS